MSADSLEDSFEIDPIFNQSKKRKRQQNVDKEEKKMIKVSDSELLYTQL